MDHLVNQDTSLLKRELSINYKIISPLVEAILKNMDKEAIAHLYKIFNVTLHGLQKSIKNCFLTENETRKYFYYILNLKLIIVKYLHERDVLWYLEVQSTSIFSYINRKTYGGPRAI